MDKVFIIAEAGVNHNGDIDLAYKLIDKAVEAKVDAIKFQTFIAEKLVSVYAPKAEYQIENTRSSESQLEMVKKLELSFESFKKLSEYCSQKGIKFLSTGFDFDSIDFLNNLGMDIFKIPSGEITNLPYLIKVAKLNKDIILSTGMCHMNEIRDAYEVLKKYGAGSVSILHCNTEYPTPMKDVNLLAMNEIKKEFDCNIGYSDHTIGIEISIAAVALGAKIIEKHFTLDRNLEGPDHKASLEPHELKYMVQAIRNIELAIGSEKKVASESEEKNKKIARRSIVAKRNIIEGEIFSEENIATKRPGNGISPMKWFDVIGSKAKRDFSEDEMIEL